MISTLKSVKSKFTPFLMAILFLAIQVASTVAISVVNMPKASAASVCTNDQQGANDEPGQKDLTQMCSDTATSGSGFITINWNWDDTGWSGNNSGDACALFSTDADNNANYSLCAVVNGNPATITDTRVYSCNDNFDDKCGNPTQDLTITSTCSVVVGPTQPFAAGSDSPNDTRATCNIVLNDVGGVASAKLTDVCSYPSQQPNSDPSDCIVESTGSIDTFIRVKKVLSPTNDPGKFNLQVDGTTQVANVGNGGDTGIVAVQPGAHTVGETAGTNTLLSNYTSTISCKNKNNSNVTATSQSAGVWSVTVASSGNDREITCTITNTVKPGSIKIVKDAVPNDGQDFGFTATGSGLSGFTLDDDGNNSSGTINNKLFSNLNPGTYTITETATTGWDLRSIDCGQASGVTVNGATVSINLAAGQNVECKFENAKRGTITVYKQTNPDGDPAQFSITAAKDSGTGTIAGNATRSISDNGSTVYDVSQGTYSISEADSAAWSEDVSQCQNLVINTSNLSRSCTITNTKYATLNIIKDAVPNGPGLFGFMATGNGVGGFTLDDDSATANVSNQKTYNQLMPGTYTVAELEAVGWALSSASCDLLNTKIERGVSITLGAGQQATCTFVNTKYGSITGQKFEDLNGNNAWDEGEPVLPGWKIYIELDGIPGYTAGDIAYDTGDDGIYLFENLLPGTYSIFEHFNQTQIDDGWVQTLAPQSVYLEAGQNVDEDTDFGNFLNGTITGFKFNDKNGNTRQDEGDNKMSGWKFTLLGDGDDADTDLDDQIQVAETNADGNYIFTNVPKGIYQVCEVQQAGWVQTIPLNNGCYLIEVKTSGQEITNLYFGNQGRGTITVVKEVYPYNDPQDFNFTISPYEEEVECYQDVSLLEVSECYETFDYVSNVAEFTLDDDYDETLSNTEETGVIPGQYVITEEQTEGWDLAYSYCEDNNEENDYEGVSQPNGHIVTVYPGSDITCYFTNVKRGTVTIVKDARPDSDQEFTFSHNLEGKYSEDFTLVDDGENTEAASTTFTNVRPGSYGITELDIDNWRQAEFSCDNEYEDDEEVLDQRPAQISEGPYDEEWFENSIYVRPGENVTCTFVNEATLVNITKSNNKPAPTVVDDQVVYTIQVQVPEEAGSIFDTTVIDLPPENFEYVPGSWTATSSVRGDLKAANITTEPTYASPGTWLLGNVVGGEFITLTYVAKILSIVTPGTYPDIAFVTGFDQDEQEVLGNVTTADSPFVGTNVAVINPVAGKIFTAPLLANTGRSLSLLNAIIPVLLVGLTLLAYRRSRQHPEKGGQL